MYIWYEATSDFRVLPRAMAVLVIVLLRLLLAWYLWAELDVWLIYHQVTKGVTLSGAKGP
jgi:hypothetical protein